MPSGSDAEHERLSMSADDRSVALEEADASLLEKFAAPQRTKYPNGAFWSWMTILNLVLFLISTVLFFKGAQWHPGTDRGCLKLQSTFSPALSDVDPVYRPVRFNGTLGYPSKYRGDPSPDVDAAWNNIEKVGLMSISEEEIVKLGKSTDAIRIPSQFGGGYMASVELNHELHCLNFLRKSLSPEYYAPPSPQASLEFFDDPSMIVTHQRHCIEMLRQFVMCHADMGIITYRWVKNYVRPYPDFSTWHQCRDFDDALQWTKNRQLTPTTGGPPPDWEYKPGPGDVILDGPP